MINTKNILDNSNFICYVLLVIILVIILYIYHNCKLEVVKNYNNNQNTNKNNKIKYINCGYQKLQNTLSTIFNKYDFIKINETRIDWDLYIPCSYNYIETKLNKIKISNSNQAIYAIKGCDKIASKNQL